MAEAKKELKVEYCDNSRINSVKHISKGVISWEQALEQVIINRLKRLKVLD